jgi:hemoglobin-like flavoprotein
MPRALPPLTATVMRPDEIVLIRSTWGLLGATTDIVAPRFYDRLFAAEPALRELFARTDMAALGDKLSHSLALVVHGIDNLERLRPELRALGVHHARLGVESRHYALVIDTLLDTFGDILRDGFSEASRDAWRHGLSAITDIMRGADVGNSPTPAAGWS